MRQGVTSIARAFPPCNCWHCQYCCKMYLFKLSNVFVQIAKYICLNCKIAVSKLMGRHLKGVTFIAQVFPPCKCWPCHYHVPFQPTISEDVNFQHFFYFIIIHKPILYRKHNVVSIERCFKVILELHQKCCISQFPDLPFHICPFALFSASLLPLTLTFGFISNRKLCFHIQPPD